MVREPSNPTANHALARKARFGAVVKTYRLRLGLSQEELAWRADMHQTYLSEVECGLRNISFTRLVELVEALRVPLSDFFQMFEKNGSSSNAPSRKKKKPASTLCPPL